MIRPIRISMLPRALGAMVLLAALLLGAVSHGWHHFADRDCESGNSGSQHPCVQCSSLHASTEPAEVAAVVLAAPEPLGLVHATHEAAASDHAPASRSARAPPLA